MRAFKTLGDPVIKEDVAKANLRAWFRQWAFTEPQRPTGNGAAISERQIKQYEEKLLNPDI